MNASIYRINLDMHKIDSQALLNIKQNDNARHIVFSLSDGGKPYVIPNNCRAVLRAIKPDETILFNDCVIKTDNTITYDITSQTTSDEGIVKCELTLYGSDNKKITTPFFCLRVDNHTVTDGEIESKNEFTVLQEALKEVESLDIDAKKEINTTTVTVTKKDGSTVSVDILDGDKGDKGDKGDPGEDAVTDEHYSPTSDNAQSGKAVAEAVNPIMRYITYSIQNGKVTITGCDTSISGDYEIPREIGGLPATNIYVLAFQNCIGLTSITIPESVTRISNGAFRGCSGLTEVKMPSSVTQIGFSAFYGCTGLTDVYYSGTETEWGDIDIDDEDEDLENATIHYNQTPAVKQDIYDYHDDTKQDTLTAGENITIENNVISATVPKWRKIVDITLEADSASPAIIINKDYLNQNFSLSHIRAYIYVPIDENASSETRGYICVRGTVSGEAFRMYGSLKMKSNTKSMYIVVDIQASPNFPTIVRAASIEQSTGYGGYFANEYGLGNTSGELTIHNSIKEIRPQLNLTEWKAGTRIIVEGVDA